MDENEFRTGKKAAGSPVEKRPWSTPTITSSPVYPIPGTHVDAAKVDGDAAALGPRVVRIQAEVADLAAEALRVRDAALQELDRLREHIAWMEAECVAELTPFGWQKMALEDYVHNLIHHNVELNRKLTLAEKNLTTTVGELREALAKVAQLEAQWRAPR